MIDQTKDNFSQPLSIKEILDELKMSKDVYCRSLSISKDEDLQLHLKRQPNSCFFSNYFDDYCRALSISKDEDLQLHLICNNHFDVGLKPWQENMDIQPVFNEYEAVTYICEYFSKTEDHCSQAMKKAAGETFENNMHHRVTMKTIAKVYLSNRVRSVLEVVYNILPKIRRIFRRIFPALYFVNKNLPEKRLQLLLSEKELAKQPKYFQGIKYWPLYGKAKCKILEWKIHSFKHFFYAEFLSH